MDGMEASAATLALRPDPGSLGVVHVALELVVRRGRRQRALVDVVLVNHKCTALARGRRRGVASHDRHETRTRGGWRVIKGILSGVKEHGDDSDLVSNNGKVGTVVFRNRKQDQGRRETRNTGGPGIKGKEWKLLICALLVVLYYVLSCVVRDGVLQLAQASGPLP